MEYHFHTVQDTVEVNTLCKNDTVASVKQHMA